MRAQVGTFRRVGVAAPAREPTKSPGVGVLLPGTESRSHVLSARLLLVARAMGLGSDEPAAVSGPAAQV